MDRLRPFIPFFLAYRWEILVGIIALLFTDALGLLIPWLVKNVIDLLPNKPSSSVLIQYAGWLFLASVGQGIARYGWRKYLFGPSRKIEVDILNRLFSHFQKLDQTFFQKQQMGDLISRSTNDLRAVKEFWGLNLLIVVDAAVVIVAGVSMMFYINPKLTLYSMIPLPMVSILFFVFIRRISQRHKAIQEHLAKITSMVQENLAGIRVLHAFVQEQNEIKKFDFLNQKHIEKNMSLARLFGLFTPSLVITTGIAAMISLWIGGKEVISGEISLGSFVAFNSYLIMLSWPMMAIGFVINLTQKGLTAMDRVQAIFESKSTLKPTESTDEILQVKGKIQFVDVSFQYPNDDKKVLRKVNLEIHQGTSLALIGMIGAGKTSLIQLVPRIYDLTEGKILIDDHPIESISLSSLRKEIGYVDQEPFLFSATIRENIAMGSSSANDEKIGNVVQCAHLTPDLERWPQGLETIVGERGVSLSGGQKQRIALARALIKEPKILILDDAFSSLDVETEKIILNNIQTQIKKITTLMVTHRFSLTPYVDNIVVLEKGRIVEQGRHQELILKQGIYQKVYRDQNLAREMEITLE